MSFRPPPGWRPAPVAIQIAGYTITPEGERRWTLEALAREHEASEIERLRAEVAHLHGEIARRDREAGARDGTLAALALGARGKPCH